MWKKKRKGSYEDVEGRTNTNRDFRKSDIDNEIYGTHRHKERGGREWEKVINSQGGLSRGKSETNANSDQ